MLDKKQMDTDNQKLGFCIWGVVHYVRGAAARIKQIHIAEKLRLQRQVFLTWAKFSVSNIMRLEVVIIPPALSIIIEYLVEKSHLQTFFHSLKSIEQFRLT